MFEVTSLCLYICMQLCLSLFIGFVDNDLRNTVLSVNKHLLQIVNVTFRFLCNANKCAYCTVEANYRQT